MANETKTGPERSVHREDLAASGSCAFDLATAWRADMRVSARIYADEELLAGMLDGEALIQLANVATLPGVVDRVYGMPDLHEGYGFPVGGVAATLLPDGVVSPGGVGFDINCGVRLLVLPLTWQELGDRLEPFVHELSRAIPTGMGHCGTWRLTDAELHQVISEGSAYLVRSHSIGIDADLACTESHGCLPGANPDAVSQRALDRGRDQLGTIGSGNHFVEVQRVESITDTTSAKAFGLAQDAVTVLIHTGSRGLGHQVCTDYVRVMDAHRDAYGIRLPDRQLSCAPASSAEAGAYLGAMACAANFAWSNRHRIAHQIRTTAARLLGVDPTDVRTVYDVSHNIAKFEQHGGRRVCVHRKGATRALGPGHPELPSAYAATGQPVFVPGSMGTASWVMAGAPSAEEKSWASACHGAGRALSRTASKRQVVGAALRRQLEEQGIVVRCPSNRGLAEEAPIAYKDVDHVAAVVEMVGIARRVARLRPLGVIKG